MGKKKKKLTEGCLRPELAKAIELAEKSKFEEAKAAYDVLLAEKPGKPNEPWPKTSAWARKILAHEDAVTPPPINSTDR